LEKRSKLIVGAIAAAAGIGIGAGAAVAAATDDRPLRGSDYERATAAALEHVGAGTVTETEVGEGTGAYEVEIRLDDGRQVEVELDESFGVVESQADDDGESDGGEGDDD
jgi:hypothetical protein